MIFSAVHDYFYHNLTWATDKANCAVGQSGTFEGYSLGKVMISDCVRRVSDTPVVLVFLRMV